VQIGEADPEQAKPCPEHMTTIQATDATI